MWWCLDLSVANGNQTNKSIDLNQTLMPQSSAFEWRSSCYSLLDWSTLFPGCLHCIKMGTLEWGGQINWRGSGHQQRALVPAKSLTILLASFLLLKSMHRTFSYKSRIQTSEGKDQHCTSMSLKRDPQYFLWIVGLQIQTAGTVCWGLSVTLHISHAYVCYPQCCCGWSVANPDTEWGQAIQRE